MEADQASEKIEVWTYQNFERYLLYFKHALPKLYPWRDHPNVIKLFLYKGVFKDPVSHTLEGVITISKGIRTRANTKEQTTSKYLIKDEEDHKEEDKKD